MVRLLKPSNLESRVEFQRPGIPHVGPGHTLFDRLYERLKTLFKVLHHSYFLIAFNAPTEVSTDE